MRRAAGLLTSLTALPLLAVVLCPNLAAQRRPTASPFPDDDEGLSPTPSRGRSFGITGVVTDADSRERLDGVRVDLQGLSGGILATAFTTGNGSFEFANVREGTYQLIFDQVGYQDSRQQVDVQGPVFGVTVALRKLLGPGPRGPSVSVRQLSIPQKARDAMGKGMALLYEKADLPGSIKQFERAIQLYPNYYEAYAQLGLAYMRMKDAEQSEKALRKSVELSQEHYPDALVLLAALFSGEKRFDDAEGLARKAVDLNPNSWHAQSELAQALVGLKRPSDAEPYAQAAVKLQPNNPLLALLLAAIHIQLRNDPASLEDLDNYLKLAPNGPFAAQVRDERDQVQQRLLAAPSPPSAPPATSQANP